MGRGASAVPHRAIDAIEDRRHRHRDAPGLGTSLDFSLQEHGGRPGDVDAHGSDDPFEELLLADAVPCRERADRREQPDLGSVSCATISATSPTPEPNSRTRCPGPIPERRNSRSV